MSDAVNSSESGRVAVDDNALDNIRDNSWLKRDIEYEIFNNKIIQCKGSGNDCTQLLQKYWAEHENNYNELKRKCANGGIVCPSYEELLAAKLRGIQKLTDLDARKIATLMLSRDLVLLDNGIDISDRIFQHATDPLLVAGIVIAKSAKGVSVKGMTKQQAIQVFKNAGLGVGVGMTTEAAIQYYLTGDINLRDVMAVGLTSGFFGAAVTPSAYKKVQYNSNGSLKVSINRPLDQKSVERLNVIDIDVNKKKPGEARAAAALEAEIGTLRRAGTVDGPVDFVVVYGPNKGKTVDFLFTPDNSYQKGKINQYFDNNWQRNKNTIDSHLRKADIVPMDMRNIIDPRHKKMIEDYVKTKSISEQSKVIFMY